MGFSCFFRCMDCVLSWLGAFSKNGKTEELLPLTVPGGLNFQTVIVVASNKGTLS